MKHPPTLSRKVRRGIARFAGSRASTLVPRARLGGPMPWVIAIMIALTTIAAAGGLALDNLSKNARAELAGGITVQILAAEPAARSREAQAAVAALAGMKGVAAVRRVPDAELSALVEPWLGEMGPMEETIPTPALIDVRLAGEVTQARLEGLRAHLLRQAPSARVDSQTSWLQPAFAAIASLQWLAAGLVALLALTSIAAVWLAARSALGSNHETIEIVHLLGGNDGQIASIFQRSVGLDAMMGGIIGLALGVLAVLILGRQFAALGSGMIAGGGLANADWLLLAAIPLAGVVLAMLTARITVLAELRRML